MHDITLWLDWRMTRHHLVGKRLGCYFVSVLLAKWGNIALEKKINVLINWLFIGTISKGAALLHQEGAREVYACTTHAVFRYTLGFKFCNNLFQLWFALRHFNHVNYGESATEANCNQIFLCEVLIQLSVHYFSIFKGKEISRQ